MAMWIAMQPADFWSIDRKLQGNIDEFWKAFRKQQIGPHTPVEVEVDCTPVEVEVEPEPGLPSVWLVVEPDTA